MSTAVYGSDESDSNAIKGFSSPPMSTRPTSPSALPFRFTGSSQPPSWHDSLLENRLRSVSLSGDKGSESNKHAPLNKKSLESISSPSSSNFAIIETTDSYSSTSYDISSQPITYSTTTTTTDTTPVGSMHQSRRSNRGSILVAASDVLGKFGRKKRIPMVRQPPPMPIILPDVIEISAPRKDDDNEAEERERYRNDAAQAIGLLNPPHFRGHQLLDDDNDDNDDDLQDPSESDQHPLPSPPISIEPGSSDLNSVIRSSGPLSPRTLSMQPNRDPQHLPAFPSTPAALATATQVASNVVKYFPLSSLRILALSKNWRSRFMVLSCPSSLSTIPTASYLHLFKSSNGDDKELERLEINESSVVFISEEEVGGRRHVIKIGGVDVGALKKEFNQEEAGRTMWFLQITDQAEAQKWITTIKTVILGQRSIRAGLGLPGHTQYGIEPRGDLDVMLSMRKQGIITTMTNKLNIQEFNSSGGTPPHSPTLPQQVLNAASGSNNSIRSQSQSTATTKPKSTVSTIKGLFQGRPRSSSRATVTSVDSVRDNNTDDTSFASIGNNLMSTAGMGMVPPSIPLGGPGLIGSHGHALDRKIISESELLSELSLESSVPLQTPTQATINTRMTNRVNRALSLGATSLQPAPRRRWTHSTSSPVTETAEGDSPVDPTSTRERPDTDAFLKTFSFGSPESKPRAPSMTSVSTIASGEMGERSSSSTHRSSKHWSRQLPQRLTPPSGPPPATPTSQKRDSAGSSIRIQVHPYATERPSSAGTGSQRSVVSGLPSFSKRASVSSAFSVNTMSTSYSSNCNHSRPGSSHRTSIPPPPRPAPTSALPPAPDQAGQLTAIPSRTSSFRDSLANRSFRLSMMAPKPPPASLLPPRPDESSTGYFGTSSGELPRTDPLPITNNNNTMWSSPFPPPSAPLPPTPSPKSSTDPQARRASLKQRLRILSAPSPLFSPQTPPSPVTPSASQIVSSRARPTSYAPYMHPPTTPTSAYRIGEKITNDPSFLNLQTPTSPSHTPKLRPLPAPPPEPYSLSPPPRRLSKQLPVKKDDNPSPRTFVTEPSTPVTDNKHIPEDMSLAFGDDKSIAETKSISPPSHRDSVVSLGIITI